MPIAICGIHLNEDHLDPTRLRFERLPNLRQSYFMAMQYFDAVFVSEKACFDSFCHMKSIGDSAAISTGIAGASSYSRNIFYHNRFGIAYVPRVAANLIESYVMAHLP